jgi:hypothetical protein
MTTFDDFMKLWREVNKVPAWYRTTSKAEYKEVWPASLQEEL